MLDVFSARAVKHKDLRAFAQYAPNRERFT